MARSDEDKYIQGVVGAWHAPAKRGPGNVGFGTTGCCSGGWALSSSRLIRPLRCWWPKTVMATCPLRKPLRQGEKPQKGEKHCVFWHNAGRWPAPRSVCLGLNYDSQGCLDSLQNFAFLCLLSARADSTLAGPWKAWKDAKTASLLRRRQVWWKATETRKGRPRQKVTNPPHPPSPHSKSPGWQPTLSSLPPHYIYRGSCL